uniref:Uncharacterized protein n=1 Tax=Lepeophtheirus salmonis TaxID=72036 RepID=A0A0K2UWJ8_LEPSM
MKDIKFYSLLSTQSGGRHFLIDGIDDAFNKEGIFVVLVSFLEAYKFRQDSGTLDFHT